LRLASAMEDAVQTTERERGEWNVTIHGWVLATTVNTREWCWCGCAHLDSLSLQRDGKMTVVESKHGHKHAGEVSRCAVHVCSRESKSELCGSGTCERCEQRGTTPLLPSQPLTMTSACFVSTFPMLAVVAITGGNPA